VAPLSANYQKYILTYLTRGGAGEGWHSRFDLTMDTLAHFEAKAAAILNEHMLTIRLRAQGCPIIDATWLATRQPQLARSKQLCVIPTWYWQIVAREFVLRHEASSLKRPFGADKAVRAALVVGESWDVARSHGSAAARSLLWQAVIGDPWLLVNRPVLGALRRLSGLSGGNWPQSHTTRQLGRLLDK
jgi:hypothetical protein